MKDFLSGAGLQAQKYLSVSSNQRALNHHPVVRKLKNRSKVQDVLRLRSAARYEFDFYLMFCCALRKANNEPLHAFSCGKCLYTNAGFARFVSDDSLSSTKSVLKPSIERLHVFCLPGTLRKYDGLCTHANTSG
jgi:hypothetical protein